MNIQAFAVEALLAFGITLVTASVVTLLWNLTFHGARAVDGETSFRLAIILGIGLGWARTRNRK